MSIRQGLLALLERGPMYGYQMRTEFESRTGGTWPLNVGQVYTTLDRLERDGLVTSAEGEAGRTTYAITDAGRAEVRRWFGTPVNRTDRPRDELAIKLAVAVTVPGVDVREVVQAQRAESMRVLRDYTRLKMRATDEDDLGWRLVLDHLVFAAEAEVRWLDHVETTLVRSGATATKTPTNAATGAVASDPLAEPTAAGRGRANGEVNR